MLARKAKERRQAELEKKRAQDRESADKEKQKLSVFETWKENKQKQQKEQVNVEKYILTWLKRIVFNLYILGNAQLFLSAISQCFQG